MITTRNYLRRALRTRGRLLRLCASLPSQSPLCLLDTHGSYDRTRASIILELVELVPMCKRGAISGALMQRVSAFRAGHGHDDPLAPTKLISSAMLRRFGPLSVTSSLVRLARAKRSTLSSSASSSPLVGYDERAALRARQLLPDDTVPILARRVVYDAEWGWLMSTCSWSMLRMRFPSLPP